jgi:hypothetical protein
MVGLPNRYHRLEVKHFLFVPSPIKGSHHCLCHFESVLYYYFLEKLTILLLLILSRSSHYEWHTKPLKVYRFYCLSNSCLNYHNYQLEVVSCIPSFFMSNWTWIVSFYGHFSLEWHLRSSHLLHFCVSILYFISISDNFLWWEFHAGFRLVIAEFEAANVAFYYTWVSISNLMEFSRQP